MLILNRYSAHYLIFLDIGSPGNINSMPVQTLEVHTPEESEHTDKGLLIQQIENNDDMQEIIPSTQDRQNADMEQKVVSSEEENNAHIQGKFFYVIHRVNIKYLNQIFRSSSQNKKSRKVKAKPENWKRNEKRKTRLLENHI
uniref:Uncharacterized protein LOC114335497 isoform X1 n=1 Tax=Diabrotica virgifera virgifera TaxID=50390 RepID=A0A6P7G3E7_DIAVI